ncbi:MAG: dihydropyrimidinase [Candidatus Eremiobacteraeota bacterium]|nr:dihydropyrimidinase [Candidatus Eremiobacteraeota bacterium]
METVIKNGTIVTAQDIYKGDVGIAKGKIALIADSITAKKGTEVIDAKGMYVMPGGIDMHVHLELPFCGTVSRDDFENGTKAAACGGLTTLIDYGIQQKGHSLLEAISARRKCADGRVSIDYSLHGGITDWALARHEMDQAIKLGVPSFKMFMVYRNEGWMADDGDLLQALEATARNGGLVMTHSENDYIIQALLKEHGPRAKELGAYGHALTRPDYSEIEAIVRVVKLAEVTGGRLFIVHMSTGGGADAVKAGQDRGVKVHAETCPQYLLLDDSLFKKKDGHLYATCPQIRKKPDIERLWIAVQRHTVEVIGTDTCTFDKAQKSMWKGDFRKIPYGMPGVETVIPLMHTYGVVKKKFTLPRLVQLCSTNPAKIFGLYPRKGTIAPGSDADITIFDPRKEGTIHCKGMQTNCDWSPFEGYKLKGYPACTLVRGKVVAKNGKFVGEKGYGQFIARKPFGELA